MPLSGVTASSLLVMTPTDRPALTPEHVAAVSKFSAAHAQRYSEVALDSCLQGLRSQSGVRVRQAFVEGEWTFVVQYDRDDFDGRLALRTTVLDVDHPKRFESQYGDDLPIPPVPERVGKDVAYFDIGEPLGTVADHLRLDPEGVYWWGPGHVSEVDVMPMNKDLTESDINSVRARLAIVDAQLHALDHVKDVMAVLYEQRGDDPIGDLASRLSISRAHALWVGSMPRHRFRNEDRDRLQRHRKWLMSLTAPIG